MSAALTYRERIFHAQDDVLVYYRDYGDDLSPRTPVLCLTGLTRNSRDFHDLATRLAPKRRVLCMDYRGRGKSGYDENWRNYQPSVYVQDVVALLAVAGVHRVVLVGTSLGGLVSMGLSVVAPGLIAGSVINDVGPEIAAEGRTRIADYVGKPLLFPTYEDAGRALMAQFGKSAPDKDAAFWTDQAQTMFVPDSTNPGQLRLNYDLRLSLALREQATRPIPDLWPLFRSLARAPMLAVRGGLSDLLSAETFARMKAAKPDLVQVLLPNRGHAPNLDEPEFLSVFGSFIDKL